ncbi:succinyl-CoA ligase alpha-chain [Histoplasma capsulatum G186AR]|uniref:Succinyl-CoA ligase alpha-chain n=1 Tax=Ajellomyces capsulatus (strain G186AR / H82 / ATCC MYA-2454 / RMSCC 2432) TaxID=447093 RepID=C0NKA3_AJECG|nr:succinyl-CoA ligase alpha-chain [Histoplasma capsulatum G186AR]EEH08294.1 succinyl-CoA ligase alpha-chain [Histoplasma capsulatum G186AR]
MRILFRILKLVLILGSSSRGLQATANVKESLAWGTKVVGGVKPGVEGEHLGLPVFPSVQVAQEKLKPDATAIYVPGPQTAQAIEEAIAAEIPLIVAVAEHVPVHDMLRIHAMLQTQSKSRLVGANCPGIISAIGRCRIGFQPLSCFAPGHIGIVAKSGTLGYETVAATTRAGLGQSLCIGVGGDIVAGTSFVDALNLFEHDEETHGIIIVGEIGGSAEIAAAEWIFDYRRRTADPKPIMAVVGGIYAPPGRVMGHAGAWAGLGDPDAQTKIRALQNAGAVMVDHPEKFGEGMRTLLTNVGGRPAFQAAPVAVAAQQRGFHTLRRPTIRRQHIMPQRRTLYLTQSQSFDLLGEKGVAIGESNKRSDFFFGISIDRNSRSPCIIASPTTNPATFLSRSRKFPFTYGKTHFTANQANIRAVASYLGLGEISLEPLAKFAQTLLDIFINKEALLLETKVSRRSDGSFRVTEARFGFDDAAYKSSKRQEDIHKLRNMAQEVPEEVEAEKEGIVYVKIFRLPGEGSIGTLVNGAGLAMNTVDALTLHGGHCANFLDTGGKATSETVKSSFQIVLSDPRVKTIFVNIFGGLTLCDMIANGIIMAFRDLDMKVPVVVRLRGTNEELGQKMIADSGLPLHAFDSFEEAASKVISLSR